jgi:hypothetical protein
MVPDQPRQFGAMPPSDPADEASTAAAIRKIAILNNVFPGRHDVQVVD